MPRSVGMNLVFRLGEVGFSLPVDDLVEIRDESWRPSTPNLGDSGLFRLGSLFFRDGEIPIVDFATLFRLPAPPTQGGNLKLLILIGETGCWGAPVSRVEGIYPQTDFTPCRASFLSILPGPRPYSELLIWHGEPLVRCDALQIERCWCES